MIPHRPRATEPNAKPIPKPSAAQMARQGQNIGSFTVKASPGFAISGYHKFELIKRGSVIKAEYCRLCSSARRTLGIAGDGQDYVKEALKFKGWPIDKFDKRQAVDEFSQLLKQKYSAYKH